MHYEKALGIEEPGYVYVVRTAGRCCLAMHMWSLQCGPEFAITKRGGIDEGLAFYTHRNQEASSLSVYCYGSLEISGKILGIKEPGYVYVVRANSS